MAQMAPLSLAEPTFRPVEMRSWVVESCMPVALRFCRAIIAPALVFTESIRVVLPFWRVLRRLLPEGVHARVGPGKRRATATTRRLPPRLWILSENRSEERRVGKEGRSRWSPYH